jgi:hypothetical protein
MSKSSYDYGSNSKRILILQIKKLWQQNQTSKTKHSYSQVN